AEYAVEEEHLRVRADRERGGITEIEHRKVERVQHIRRRSREEIEHCRQLDPLKVVHAPSLLGAAVRAMSERWTEPDSAQTGSDGTCMADRHGFQAQARAPISRIDNVGRPTKEASRDLPTALTRCHGDEENRTCGRGGLSMDNVASPVDVERLWRRMVEALDTWSRFASPSRRCCISWTLSMRSAQARSTTRPPRARCGTRRVGGLPTSLTSTAFSGTSSRGTRCFRWPSSR